MRSLIFSIFVVVLFAACNNQRCTNINPVFEKYQPDDEEYRAELARVIALANKDSLTAWIDSYNEKHGREYMYVNMVGRGICAIAVMDITNNPELEPYRRVKGRAYAGAYLPHLKYHIERAGNSYHIVLDKVGTIID